MRKSIAVLTVFILMILMSVASSCGVLAAEEDETSDNYDFTTQAISQTTSAADDQNNETTQTATTTTQPEQTTTVQVIPPITSITLNYKELTLGVGETKRIKYTTDSPQSTQKVVFSSSDEKVFKISSKGLITAVSKGSATAYVRVSKDVYASCKVTVLPAAQKVSLNKTTLTLGVGESFDFNSSVPKGTAAKKRSFSSSSAILTHKGSGVFKAEKKGTATVSVTLFNGKSATCKVTVLPAAQKVSLNKTTLTLGIGESFSFVSSVPKGTASYVRNFQSSSSVLSHSGSGVFVAKKKGTAKVTVTLFNGKKANCTVTVLPAAQKVSLNKTSLTLGLGESFDFNSSVPKGTASYKRAFKSSSSVLSHSGSGVFVAKKKGTAKVTVTLFNGKKATCTVTVLPAAQKVSLNKTSLTLGVGESFDFNSYVPGGTASYQRAFKSSSSVLTYKGSGIFKAEKKGSATVSVTLFNGKKATCKVTVLPAAKKVTLNKTKLTLGIGESFTFKYELGKGTASYQTKFTSSDISVLKHNGSGKFIAKKSGTAVVKLVLFNGKYAACTVTVKPLPSRIYTEEKEITLPIGSSKKVKVLCPSGTGCKGYTYKSSNKYNVSYDADGTLHARREGSATITVTSSNKKTCTFKVAVTRMRVPFVSQVPKYPTGCEAASCVELLRYYGYNVTLDEMVKAIPRRSIYYKNGKRHGPDINEYFVGNPKGGYTSSDPGYGAFSPCVTKSLQKVIDQKGGKHKAVRISGCSFNTLLNHISSGRPAIVWATYRMKVPTTVNSWYITETGKYFEYPRGTHVMVLAGYSDSTVTIVDPYDGICRFNIDTFEKRWNLLGKQAIILK